MKNKNLDLVFFGKSEDLSKKKKSKKCVAISIQIVSKINRSNEEKNNIKPMLPTYLYFCIFKLSDFLKSTKIFCQIQKSTKSRKYTRCWWPKINQ
ncbi:hypothetical protein DERP_006588 [Dermatophagoides pteronyssinus]|uniref:Uncharacterized protein n=1 Tax=Dermatophagoides pteronyssinus TaxID=6956 RepID=A0ABQ8IQL6_DERPT|nr:hypothetical protein DERP_006588 [Dermatophagoides pteronyssinus]